MTNGTDPLAEWFRQWAYPLKVLFPISQGILTLMNDLINGWFFLA